MRCPICGQAELYEGTRDIPYSYKGEHMTVRDVAGEWCPACGDGVLEVAESARMGELILGFNKEVNASIVDPEFIVRVRKKLALDQREAAEILGVG